VTDVRQRSEMGEVTYTNGRDKVTGFWVKIEPSYARKSEKTQRACFWLCSFICSFLTKRHRFDVLQNQISLIWATLNFTGLTINSTVRNWLPWMPDFRSGYKTMVLFPISALSAFIWLLYMYDEIKSNPQTR